MQNSTPEEIKKNRELLGEVKKKITIHFSDKGVGVDTTETGVSCINIIQAMLALSALVERDCLTRAIGMLDDYPKIERLVELATEAMKKKEQENGVSE